MAPDVAHGHGPSLDRSGALAFLAAGRRLDRCGERGVLPEDLPLELLKRGSRIESELLGELLSALLVDVERFALPAGAIQGEHQLPSQPFALWVRRDK